MDFCHSFWGSVLNLARLTVSRGLVCLNLNHGDFLQPGFAHKPSFEPWHDFQAFSKGTAHWDHFLKLILSRRHIPNKSTMVTFVVRMTMF